MTPKEPERAIPDGRTLGRRLAPFELTSALTSMIEEDRRVSRHRRVGGGASP